MDLRPWNPHWHGAPISPLIRKHPQVRAAVAHWVDELLAQPEWMLRVGPRQVGKTTSLGHVASQLLERGVAPRQVAIVACDDEQVIEGGVDAIISEASKMHAPSPRLPLYLLLDEVQELPDWSRRLKAAWDKHHLHVRVLATGSSAQRLLRPVNADFPGRIRTVTIHPMKFREVLEAHPRSAEHEEALAGLRQHAVACRQALLAGHEATADALEELHGFLHAHGAATWLAQVWLEYLAWGGYPATRPGTDEGPHRLERFEAAWNAVAAKDVVAAGIKKLREFKLLFSRICSHPGGKFEPFAVGKRLSTDGATIQHWKQVLEDTMLVQQLPPLKPNLRPDLGRDKAYPTDPGWTSYMRSHLEATPESDVVGLAAETVLVDHCCRLQFNVQGTTALAIGYVSEPEVDVAANLGPHWLLLEAKYRSQPRAMLRNVGGPDDVRIVATRDVFQLNPSPDAHFVPAHELAAIC